MILTFLTSRNSKWFYRTSIDKLLFYAVSVGRRAPRRFRSQFQSPTSTTQSSTNSTADRTIARKCFVATNDNAGLWYASNDRHPTVAETSVDCQSPAARHNLFGNRRRSTQEPEINRNHDPPTNIVRPLGAANPSYEK